MLHNSRPSAATAVRKHPRYRCNQRLCVRYRTQDRDVIAYGRCTVAGKGGIDALLTKVELNVGEEVSLEIALSQASGTVALSARVKNRRGFNHGFEFLENAGRVTVTLKPLFQPEAIIFSLPAPEVPQLFSTQAAQRPPERVPVAGEVTLVLPGASVEIQVSASLINISRGGFRVGHAYAQLAAGQQLRVVYMGVSIPACVVWSRAAGGRLESGLAVLDDDDDRPRIPKEQ
ncbi:MAG TPA: PilZ domain-containing protein [Candidatus Saccharimonadales bacterium]|jgi:hypothetical protein|nr:PilZ domain-containing protein [Candidatus Saccharimonadales bacterium]